MNDVAGDSNQLVKPLCSKCGSWDVHIDAVGMWNIELQKWVLTGTLDSGSCRACGMEFKNSNCNWVKAEVKKVPPRELSPFDPGISGNDSGRAGSKY